MGKDGSEVSRTELQRMAKDMGLVPVSEVTKKGCDLLVAADASSQSGKAATARKFGLPIASLDDFLNSQIGAELPVRKPPRD